MDYRIHSHRNAEIILKDDAHRDLFTEVIDVISGISDEDIKRIFTSSKRPAKSISESINKLLKSRFIEKGWNPESAIFQGDEFNDKAWRLDFAKGSISIEVAFNHGEAIAWNLMKPVLASEVNNVQKAIQTDVGILIVATKALKAAGGFDSAVGEFEKVERYLTPMRTYLTVPIAIIGLEAPKTFKITHTKEGTKHRGHIIDL
jgi:hypothetical protein